MISTKISPAKINHINSTTKGCFFIKKQTIIKQRDPKYFQIGPKNLFSKLCQKYQKYALGVNVSSQKDWVPKSFDFSDFFLSRQATEVPEIQQKQQRKDLYRWCSSQGHWKCISVKKNGTFCEFEAFHGLAVQLGRWTPRHHRWSTSQRGGGLDARFKFIYGFHINM